MCLYLCASDIELQLRVIRAKAEFFFLPPKWRLPVMRKHRIPYSFQARRFPLGTLQEAGPLYCSLSITDHPSHPGRFCPAHQKATLSGFRAVRKKVLEKLWKCICPSLSGEWAGLETNHFSLVGGRRRSDQEGPIPRLQKAPILFLLLFLKLKFN